MNGASPLAAIRVVAFGVVAALLVQDVRADESAAGMASAATLPDLEALVDGAVGAYMSQQRIAGVQVAVVRNGETLLVKGYGIASLEPRRAVDPQRSLFRIGSISKTFTWLALMQLAERGRLKIDGPINDYLPDDLDVPDQGFEQPIRVIDLMNHTAGFEDAVQALFLAEDVQPLPLNEHLRRYRPHRVREPGKLMAYSNYGSALAGAIVAHLSGMQFETYVERNILAPLGMMHTTFREQYPPADGLPEPMAAELAAHLAQSLESQGGAWRAIPHEHVSMSPAGSAVSTAADMARYMIALLEPQHLEDAGVLTAATLARLREPTFQSAPGMPAIHHGFFNMPLGTRTRLEIDNLSHGGATLHFRSLLALIPDLSGRPTLNDADSAADHTRRAEGTLGIFVTANSAPAGGMVTGVVESILTRYFPRLSPEPAPPGGAAGRVREYVGHYRPARRSYTKLEKLLSAVAAAPVTAAADGYLVMHLNERALRFVEIGEDLFRQVDGDATIAFRRDAAGVPTHVVTSVGALERVGFFMSALWLTVIVVLASIACVGVLVAAWLRRKHAVVESVAERRSATVLLGISIAWLAVIVLCAAWAASLAGPQAQDRFVYGYPQPLLKVALAALLVVAGLSVLGVATLVPVWRDRSWTVGRRCCHSIAVLVFAALVVTLLQWNAIGFRYF